MGLIGDEQPAMYKVLEAAGLAHGKSMQSYLCMMTVRLLEMRRVLKESGSIYLHCDPTASHYLKLLIDSIYNARTFRAEITWKRTSAHSDSRTLTPSGSPMTRPMWTAITATTMATGGGHTPSTI